MKRLVISLLLSGLLWQGLSPASATASEDGNFQIMKATADKIWRLNKSTGEISVCSLDGDRLLCTSSTEAIRPPTVTYDERQAEKKRMSDDKKAKELEFLDRALAAVRSLFEATLENKRDVTQ